MDIPAMMVFAPERHAPEVARRDDGPSLARAVVEAVNDGALAVRIDGGAYVEAELALAFPYEAQPGDVVLVIAQGAECFVIGVIAGRGTVQLRFPADVRLASDGGRVHIDAAAGVEIDAPDVTIRAGRLSLFATTLAQRAHQLTQAASELLSIFAERSHTVVAQSAHTQAGSATLMTREAVTINGKVVHLG